MLDRRCRYKIRQLQEFYLFVKHNTIYYAYYPQFRITRSTHCSDLQKAYIAAWNIYSNLDKSQNQLLYKPFTDKKRQRDLTRALSYVDQSKPLTESAIKSMQQKMVKEGLSGKSINNYIYILRRSYTEVFPAFKTMEHTATYRSCFPITSLYGFWQKCTDRIHYLAFFAMTTGCRAGEIYNCEPLGNNYLKINGTKTKNAVRTIPVLPETLACLEYLQSGFRSSAYKESVLETGRLCGFDNKYVEDNHIVFHSFRKVYKTLLVSANINTQYGEYLMGHSQTRTVNQLYFVADSMDREKYDEDVRNALRRFI